MSRTTTFNAQLLGQTEKAANAILDRLLAEHALTEHQWITLNLTLMSDNAVERDQLVARLVDALKINDVQAQARISELAEAQLLDVPDRGRHAPVKVTDAGLRLHGRIHAAVTQITQRLWGDLPATELATAGRVLSTVLARADAELARAEP